MTKEQWHYPGKRCFLVLDTLRGDRYLQDGAKSLYLMFGDGVIGGGDGYMTRNKGKDLSPRQGCSSWFDFQYIPASHAMINQNKV